MSQKLIQHIDISKSKVFPGESFRITVYTRHPVAPWRRVDVWINGKIGNVQQLQMNGKPGARTLVICAITSEKYVEVTEVKMVVLESQPENKQPILEMRQSHFDYLSANFEIVNVDELNLENPMYAWEFGDGSKILTRMPYQSHCYENAIGIDTPYTVFQVRVSIFQDSHQVFEINRTVSAWNSNYFNKQHGFVQPRVEADHTAKRDRTLIFGQYTIRNLENERLTFSARRIEYRHNDSGELSTSFKLDECKVSVGPKQSLKQRVEFVADEIGSDVVGFAVHLRGKTASGLNAFASAYFDIKDDFWTRSVSRPETLKALSLLRDSKLLSNPKVVKYKDLFLLYHDKVTKDTVEIGHAVTSLLVPTECKEEDETTEPLDPNVCSLDTCGSPPSPAVSCQLTDEEEDVKIPGRFLNARKGDVIVSPGGPGFIGGLLRQLDYPQLYSHSGIMVSDYMDVRHSTASQERLLAYLETTHIPILGEDIPTSGFRPDVLKYGWPGTITQTADEAFNGSQYLDPENGECYKIDSFGERSAAEIEGTLQLIEARVVKPNPFDEDNDVRSRLHRVAEAAERIDGHYRFFAYTNGGIANNTAYNAPIESDLSWLVPPGLGPGEPNPTAWAAGTRPTVCSTFIWAAAKDAEFQVEGVLEPEPEDHGAVVDATTVDGLYFYSEEERRRAAIWMRNHLIQETTQTIVKKVEDEVGVIDPNFPYTGIPPFPTVQQLGTKIANQICNTFAFDWSDEASMGSTRWIDPGPGVGRSVSPDNIKDFWDEPRNGSQMLHGLYGYSEPLIYVPGIYEKRTINRWLSTGGSATLQGHVNYEARPVMGAVVRVACYEVITDEVGWFSVDIPSGRYMATASSIQNDRYLSGEQEIKLEAGNLEEIVIDLQYPPERNRRVIIFGIIDTIDDEWVTSDEGDHHVFTKTLELTDDREQDNISIERRVGGELRIELTIRAIRRANYGVRIRASMRMYEGVSSGSTSDLADSHIQRLTIPVDGQQSYSRMLINRESGGGDTSRIEFTVFNAQRPY